MARRKPTPPPYPNLPFFTIDTFASILFRPLLSPTASLLPPLILLALRHSLFSRLVLFSFGYTFFTLSLQLLAYIDGKVAGGTPRTLNWEDEVVLITGGAGGLGTCLAEAWAMRGVDVAVVDVLPEEELISCTTGRSATGDRVSTDTRTRRDAWADAGCTYYSCDVGSLQAVEELKARVEKELGPPTILINAAARATPHSLLTASPTTLSQNLQVNLHSHIHTIQAFLPAMLLRPHGGTLVTISSVLGHLGCAGLADYTAAKAALIALHHSLTAELALTTASATESDESQDPATRTRQQQQQQQQQQHQHQGRINTILVTPGQLSTPLFEQIVTPSAFFGPVMSPAALAAAIVRAVDEGRDAEVSLPLYACLIGIWGALPAGVRRILRRVVGLDRAGWDALQAQSIKH